VNALDPVKPAEDPLKPVRARLLLAASFAVLVLGGACSSGGGDDAGRLTVDGRAEVSSTDGEVTEVRGRRTLAFGDAVKVVEGTAVLRLDRDRQLELRTGTDVVLREADDEGQRVLPVLRASDLLVQAPPGARLTVSTEGADVIVGGGAQISRGPVLVVSSYEGTVELRAGDRSTTVPALRQIGVPDEGTGAVPDRPSPLGYDVDDPWDRRFLSDAIELGNELEARSKGFTAQLGSSEGRTPDFLLRLLPDLADQPEFGPTLFDAARPPGESLIGAAIALGGARGTFGERWAAIFGFRGEGAQWGLVALDQGVNRAPLLAAVDAAIGRGPRPFEPVPLPPSGGSAAPGGGVGQPGTPGSGGSGSGGTGSGGTGAGGSTPSTAASGPAPAPSPPRTAPPPSTPSPEIGPLNTGIPLIDETINALVETLSGLLRSLGS
jgi:hypothetical protein